MAITAFDLLIALGVDSSGVSSGLNSAGNAVSGFAASMNGVISALGKGALIAMEHGVMVLTEGIKTAASGIVSLTQQAVAQYGEYEQMVGGTKLLFGDAYDFIMEKSSQAYKNVQMSSTDYLRQVNGFSTGLKTSLNGDAIAAAKLADRIVNAEADVVAATGVSADRVQNAFNGVMRNNFTMLDNLQLGIKPTKEGMEELIKTVNQFNATTEGRTATNYEMGNLADMQAALIDYIEMQGLSGYAAREASDTIQGSVASMKAAWDDLITGLGNKDADMGSLITNFVEVSVATLEQSLLPTIGNVLDGIGGFVEKLVPIIQDKLPKLIDTAVPVMVNGIRNIMHAVSGALPDVMAVVLKEIPSLVGEFGKLIRSGLYSALLAIKDIIPLIPDFLKEMVDIIKQNGELIVWAAKGIVDTLISFVEGYINDNFDSIVSAVLNFMIETANKLPEKAEAILDKIVEIGTKIKDVLVNNVLPILRDIVLPMVLEVMGVLVAELPSILSIVSELISAIVENIAKFVYENASTFVGMIVATVSTIVQTALSLLPTLLDAVLQILQGLANAISENLTPFMTMVITILNEVVSMIFENLPTLLNTVIEVLETIVQAIAANVAIFLPAVVDIVMAIVNGLIEMLPVLIDAFMKLNLIGTHVIEDNLPMFVQAAIEVIGAIAGGLIENSYAIISAIVGLVAVLFNTFTREIKRINWAELGWQIIEGIINGFVGAFGRIQESIQSFGTNFLSTVQNVLGIHSPSRLMADKVGKFLALGVGEGFEDNMPDIGGMINTDFNIRGNVNGNDVIQVVSPVYIGDTLLDTYVTQATARTNYKSGGR